MAGLLYDVRGARAFHRGEVSDPDSVAVRALDEVTLVVELEGPTGYFLHLLAHHSTYPVPRHAIEAHGEAWTEVDNIVTNGPFIPASRQDPGRGGTDPAPRLCAPPSAGEAVGEKIPHVTNEAVVLEGRHHRAALG